MFKKVLIAEDQDNISRVVLKALENLKMPVIDHMKYCDEGILKIKKTFNEDQSSHFLVTDLSSKRDYYKENLVSAGRLIEEFNKTQSKLKKIVLSVEEESCLIKTLLIDLGINVQTSKNQSSVQGLKTEIEINYNNKGKILSANINFNSNNRSFVEIESYDISILQLLAQGYTLESISNDFKVNLIVPNGTSSIDKRINKLKVSFKANNNAHLIGIAKDCGLI